jgi:hypothetical protein
LYQKVRSTLALSLTVVLASGCTALSSTTRQAGSATVAISHGVTYVSKATGNASITRPNVPRYADATAFVRSQRALLRRQAAAGGGEDIRALAILLNKTGNDELGRWMQMHYASLFGQTPSLSAQAVVDRIDMHEG